MIEQNIEADISFRFLNLDKLQAFTLTREVQGATYSKDVQNDCYVGSVPLSGHLLDSLNIFYVRQQVKLIDCDILIALTSSAHSGMFVTPQIVNQMLKHIDCRLTFFFTQCE